MAVRSQVALLLALSLAAPTALGAPTSDAVRSGKEALNLRRYEEAAAIFARGLDAATDERERWQMLLGLALAHELGGDSTAAASYYQTFLTEAASHPDAAKGRWPERRKSAEDDLAALETRILETQARVELRSDPPGAIVRIEGTPPAPGESNVRYLPPGQHTVELRLDGYLPLLVVVSVEKGQRVAIERSLVPLPTPPPIDEPPRAAEPAVTPEITPSATIPSTEPAPLVAPPTLDPLGWSMVGVGTTALAIGVGLSAAAVSTGHELEALQQEPIDNAVVARDATLRNRLGRLQNGATALYAGGGALVVAGALVLILDASREETSAHLSPLIGPGFVGARGAF